MQRWSISAQQSTFRSCSDFGLLLLGGQTYLSANLGFTAILSFFTLYTPSSLDGTKPKSATWSEVSAIWKRMSEFSTISQLNGNFNGLIFGMKHDIHNGQVRCKLQGVSYIISERRECWSTNGL